METTQSSAISMRKKVMYSIVGCVMGGLLIASIVMTFSFGLLSEDTDYLQMALAVAGMLFAAILFVCRLIHPTPLSAASKPLAVEKGGKA